MSQQHHTALDDAVAFDHAEWSQTGVGSHLGGGRHQGGGMYARQRAGLRMQFAQHHGPRQLWLADLDTGDTLDSHAVWHQDRTRLAAASPVGQPAVVDKRQVVGTRHVQSLDAADDLVSRTGVVFRTREGLHPLNSSGPGFCRLQATPVRPAPRLGLSPCGQNVDNLADKCDFGLLTEG